LPLNFKFDGKDFLPNSVPGRPEDSFIAGDPRCNELPSLTAVQTIFLREHNRLANEISKAASRLNLFLSDQFIWELARFCNILQYQKIVYNEWLPSIIGRYAPRLQDIRYNENIDPTTTLEVATVAMRFAHSIIGNSLIFFDQNLNTISQMPMSQAFFNPNIVKQLGIDPILRWVCHERHQNNDIEIANSLREELFLGSMNLFDLIAIDIQRGRDVGMPGYSAMRYYLFGERIYDFKQISSNIQVQQKLSSVYSTVDKIDPLIGMLAEDPIGDSIVGKSFAILLFNAFNNYARGDRCFHTNIPFPWCSIFEEGGRFSTLSELLVANTIIQRKEIPFNAFKSPN